MKLKIFNKVLLALMAAVAAAAPSFAQQAPAIPAAPPAKIRYYKELDTEGEALKPGKLQIKIADLQKEMAVLSARQIRQMAAVITKGFDKKFTAQFKDFGKDFAGSFKDMVPDRGGVLRGLNTISVVNNDDYKRKLASGEIIEKTKNYSKTYNADGDDLLQIDNRFGKITVNTWNKKEFRVDVKMIFGSEDEDVVNEMINGSSISDSRVGSTVSFRTNLARNTGNNGDNHIEVNYVVHMPAGNPLDVTNKFGGVTLPDLSGRILLRLSYGSLNAQQLLNKDNDVKVRFGDANIVTFDGGKLDVGYGKLKAGTVNNVDADISFGGFSVDRLKNSVAVNIKYGDGFNIGMIDKSVRNLNINASFTKINIDFSESESFNFDITTKFGSFNYNDDKVKVVSKSSNDEERRWSSTKSYKGYIGNTNTDGKIVINASYTGVRFK